MASTFDHDVEFIDPKTYFSPRRLELRWRMLIKKVNELGMEKSMFSKDHSSESRQHDLASGGGSEKGIFSAQSRAPRSLSWDQ